MFCTSSKITLKPCWYKLILKCVLSLHLDSKDRIDLDQTSIQHFQTTVFDLWVYYVTELQAFITSIKVHDEDNRSVHVL